MMRMPPSRPCRKLSINAKSVDVSFFKPIPKPGPVPPYVIADYSWIDLHYTELARKHPNKWVAVVKGKVVGVGLRIGFVLKNVQRTRKCSDVAVQFIENPPRFYFSDAV